MRCQRSQQSAATDLCLGMHLTRRRDCVIAVLTWQLAFCWTVESAWPININRTSSTNTNCTSTMDCSYHGRFVRWTIRITDDSYYGLFVPFTNITFATKANVYLSVSLFIIIVCMHWTISIIVYQCLLSIFHANKRVQLFILPIKYVHTLNKSKQQ